jgi:threonine synthase
MEVHHFSSRLACPRCGLYFDERVFHSECTNCGSLLDLDLDTDQRGDDLRAAFDMRLGDFESGVWRYRELVLPTIGTEMVSWPEGNTPLIVSDRVATFAGVSSLMLKHEGMNPTGSFKDRGMTVAISQAKRIGARAVACASTGNTSASLAAYASRAGLPAVVLIPAGKIAGGKLAQTLAHGARTVAVRGSFDDCLRLLREASEKLGVYVVNSVNPFRLAGQRTIVLEMLHQLAWQSPDWIALPAGNLGNTSAFGEAIRLAHHLKLITKKPRLLAAQAAGAAPFARGFETGKRETVESPETVATAIRIGAPASWDRAMRAIRETNGHVTAVSDEQIMEAKREIDAAGVGCEPASAASVAGVRQMVSRGIVKETDRVVAVLTGHLLKDPAVIIERQMNSVEINPNVGELERVLGDA